ncbi:MAG: hypothetical protein O4804_18530 [Trichodesmium sp. St11_bin5]|nr:hypothetical protein [Trichodesmium sp. St11_bin5]
MVLFTTKNQNINLKIVKEIILVMKPKNSENKLLAEKNSAVVVRLKKLEASEI